MTTFFSISSQKIPVILLVLLLLFACSEVDRHSNDDSDSFSAPPDNSDPYLGPDPNSEENPFLGDSEAEEALIRRWAPLIIQRLPSREPAYDPTADYIGQVSLHLGNEYPYVVSVDWKTRVVYATARLVKLGTTNHYQLTYFIFYPERPLDGAIESNSPLYFFAYFYSGPIDGKALRVTLDKDSQTPLLLEVANLSSTDYRLYVSKKVDYEIQLAFEEAGVEYTGPARPEIWAERYIEVMDPSIDGATWRPVFLLADGYNLGFHRTLHAWTSYESFYFEGNFNGKAIMYTDPNWYIFDAGQIERTDYVLRPWEELYKLPAYGYDEQVGIFDRWGMIWNAYTPLAKMFNEYDLPVFLGTPRDVKDLRIVTDRFDFNDPKLFEKLIYLPESLF